MRGVHMDSFEKEIFSLIRVHREECPQYYEFCRSIYENRFFANLRNPIFEEISTHVQDWTDILYQGTTVYRARVIPKNTEYESQKGFDVLNEKEIGAPSMCSEGRGNPAYTTRLYVADTPYCAMSEVRPACGQNVAIGSGTVLKDLKYLSFVDWPVISNSEIMRSGKTIKEVLDRAFAAPTSDNKNYLPTQVLAEFVRLELKLDGIAYSSSQCPGGINYFLFDTSCVKFYSAKNFTVENVGYTAISYYPKYKSLTPHERDI